MADQSSSISSQLRAAPVPRPVEHRRPPQQETQPEVKQARPEPVEVKPDNGSTRRGSRVDILV